jgi:hypothetical protein
MKIEHAVLTSFRIAVKATSLVGQIETVSVETGEVYSIRLDYPRGNLQISEEILELQRCAHPEVPGKKPPPELSLEVEKRGDALYLVSFERMKQ